MASDPEQPPQACPVDHKTREAWLEKARATQAAQPPAAIPTGESCESGSIDQSTASKPSVLSKFTRFSLDTSREVSTIPRAQPSAPVASAAAGSHSPANNEQESGSDAKSGNWIYPSEQMFFDAMKRKNYDPQAPDMKSIVPIHNAVNEKAWQEIKAWEKGRGSEACGGPRLVSFSGQATALTPRARFNSLLGYQPPFDRHDWIVDRCGQQIEYVIDFYSGRDEGKSGKSLNFYLDVRPKLNSVEGCRMRVMKFFGL
ncbi:Cytochrome c1 heme lyase [Zalaria obscura]|uniref:Cytochrome c1 heme lyase n=1 Tax=Zalaria obscura TaxID=2024903 RepID=A0ACC3SIZ4_9PEZI